MKNKENSCQMCGKCCHYDIPITLLDIHRIALNLNESDKKIFRENIQSKISSRISLFLIRKKNNNVCIFLTNKNKCSIQSFKPRACEFYFCNFNSNRTVLPWTGTCNDSIDQTKLWEQSIAHMITKAYILKNQTKWNESDYFKSILSIYDNIKIKDSQKIKLGRDEFGISHFMIYDCSECEKRGTWAKETPITLDDIERIRKFLKISWEKFFSEIIDIQISKRIGILKLKRNKNCIFYDEREHCTIKEVRPMHCRFTPCPKKTKSDELMDSLYLGSGTVEEQFRHQISLDITRQYVIKWGIKYNKQEVKKYLNSIKQLMDNKMEFEKFCNKIAPYRYIDDTFKMLMDQKKG